MRIEPAFASGVSAVVFGADVIADKLHVIATGTSEGCAAVVGVLTVTWWVRIWVKAWASGEKKMPTLPAAKEDEK